MKKPNFFIIGAPKCGTTSLAAWLSEHPNIYMSPVKEPHFYSKDLKLRAITTRQEYESLFKKAKSVHLAVGEASVFYLFSQVAILEIEKEHPGAKYIVMVRNPIEMAYSFHEQQIVSGEENIHNFAKAWRLSPERRQGKAVSRWCREPKLLDYQSVCKLGEQIERLFELVPRERVLVLVLDDVKENPRREWVKVLNFLGVPDDGRLYFPVKNPAKELRWPTLQKVVRIGGRMWSSFKKSVGISRRIGFSEWVYQHNLRYRPRPPLNDIVRLELCKYFREDVEKLSQLLNRDLTYWVNDERIK